MNGIKRTVVVISILLIGVALAPYVGISANKFSWEKYALLYVDPIDTLTPTPTPKTIAPTKTPTSTPTFTPTITPTPTPIPQREPLASISEISPNNGLNDTPVTIFITGDNFSPGMWANLSDGHNVITIEGLLFIDSTRLCGTIPVNIPPGLYDFTLTDIYGGGGTLIDAYTSLATNDDLLTLDSTDLWSNPPGVESGETVNFGLTIRRQGGVSDLVDVAVDFYLDAPSTAEGGTLIGRGNADLIIPNGTGNAATPWVPPAPGQYTIYAIIDPDNQVPEDPTNNITSRTLTVFPNTANLPPVIDGFEINHGAVKTTERLVYLDVSASNGETTPDYLLYIEYLYIQNWHDWIPVAISEWLPYNEACCNFEWNLQPRPGVHYLQVWAVDHSGLVSVSPGRALINYLPWKSHAAVKEVHVYHYAMLKGEIMWALLSSQVGDADLYIWDPNDEWFIEPSWDETKKVEQVQFTANMDGIYQVEVEGYVSADYNLVINLAVPLENNNGGLDIQVPIIRGRGRPLTGELPDENIGLPGISNGQIYLPLIKR